MRKSYLGEETDGRFLQPNGAAVGATYPKMGEGLKKDHAKSYDLFHDTEQPGWSGQKTPPFFNEDGLGAIINLPEESSVYKQDAHSQFGRKKLRRCIKTGYGSRYERRLLKQARVK